VVKLGQSIKRPPWMQFCALLELLLLAERRLSLNDPQRSYESRNSVLQSGPSIVLGNSGVSLGSEANLIDATTS